MSECEYVSDTVCQRRSTIGGQPWLHLQASRSPKDIEPEMFQSSKSRSNWTYGVGHPVTKDCLGTDPICPTLRTPVIPERMRRLKARPDKSGAHLAR